MNSIGPMNFFRTTDTTDTTIWKPALSHRRMNKQRVSLKLKKEKKKVCCETKLIFRALALRQNEMRISAWCVVHTLYNHTIIYILTYMLGRRYVSGGNVVGEKMNKLVTCFSM